MDLSVVIPARNEEFLKQTVENVLSQMRGDSEMLVVEDGYSPDPPLTPHPRLRIIHNTESIGQRAATNQAARESTARFVMKLDAHCSVDEGFDVKLMRDCQPDWTLIPTMWNLHAFDWQCQACGRLTYQGVQPAVCDQCQASSPGHEQVMVWKPRHNRETCCWRFDRNLQFQYWKQKDKQAQRDNLEILETMSFIGACMFLERERFWALGGMDEAHGSWGQFGTEWACKTWLSGGSLITSRRTWFAHMFRTGNFAAPGHSTWPYPMSQEQIDRAREYSRWLWLGDNWAQQIHPLEWLIDRFQPIPDWHE